jgi:hypothetical protein
MIAGYSMSLGGYACWRIEPVAGSMDALRRVVGAAFLIRRGRGAHPHASTDDPRIDDR